jgi:hypothetical protein
MFNKEQKMFSANVVFERDEEGVLVTVAVNKVFNTCGDGYWSEVAKEVFVNSITMFVGTVKDDDYYYDGDMGINYDESTWDNSADGLIYTDSLFIAQVREYLIAQGFNADAVSDIEYSEQGMQDDGRVSCDAYEFADNMRETLVEVD